ncbi:uncharacterized protein Pyn_09960 [Prunus yedoensis var. nudiflora]|uniref:Uncharacterized protein n=1 Tax=Prunus yedoensis var. nudiflora TaxID=2094558 RepID=A0A314XQ53_PRUYE|nr:uncharacterized protein Pyn_09960 [Prunus yedoensis var. nudiflora]
MKTQQPCFTQSKHHKQFKRQIQPIWVYKSLSFEEDKTRGRERMRNSSWGSGAIALWLETLDIRADVAKVVLAGAVSKGENTSGVFSDPEQPVGKKAAAFFDHEVDPRSTALMLSFGLLFGLIKWCACDPLSGGNVKGNGWLV